MSSTTRPAFLIPAVISFAAGIGMTNVRYVPSGPAAWILVAALSLAILALHLKQIPFIASILTLPLFFLVGSLHVRPFLDLPDNPLHIYNQIEERQEVSLTGILMESPAVGPKKSRLLMRVERLTRPGGTTDSTGLVQLSLKGNPPPDLIPGDRFMARAILSRVRSNTTPGTFDLKQFLALKSILVTGWIRSPCLLTEIHDLNPPTLFNRIQFSPERARKKINDFLANTADERVMGLYKAILTGDRSGVFPNQLENFRTAGCVHLLAISGLHMGLLALFITFSITWLLKRSEWLLLHIPALKTAAFLALPFLTSYALIAGFQTPVVRALIMTSVFVMALLFDSQWSIPTNIAIAALIILTLNPTGLYTVSFQLSFAAVIAIALIVPAISGLLCPFSHGENDKSPKFAGIKKWALASIYLSIAAMLGTMPLLMYNFNRFSPVSPVSTLIVEPLLCFWALIIGLLASPLIPFFPQIAAGLIKIGCWGLLAADKAAELLADLPFSSIWVSTPTTPEVICYYIFLISLALLKKIRAASIITILSLITIISVPVIQKAARDKSSATAVTILDVGQGASAVLDLPHGRTILIDGGSAGSGRYNVGDRVIGPFLWKQRISRLSSVIVSHPNSDHYNGLFFILKRFRPETLWINGDISPGSGFEKLIRLADRLGIKIKTPRAGTTIFRDKETKLKCVSSLHLADNNRKDNSNRPEITDSNNQSLVLRLDCGPYSFLFPGDIEKKAEEILIKRKRELDADVLLSPHHGSGTSNSDQFLKAVSPQYMVISAGSYRPNIFPDPKMVTRSRESGIKVFNTAHEGAVSFVINDNEMSVTNYVNE